MNSNVNKMLPVQNLRWRLPNSSAQAVGTTSEEVENMNAEAATTDPLERMGTRPMSRETRTTRLRLQALKRRISDAPPVLFRGAHSITARSSRISYQEPRIGVHAERHASPHTREIAQNLSQLIEDRIVPPAARTTVESNSPRRAYRLVNRENRRNRNLAMPSPIAPLEQSVEIQEESSDQSQDASTSTMQTTYNRHYSINNRRLSRPNGTDPVLPLTSATSRIRNSVEQGRFQIRSQSRTLAHTVTSTRGSPISPAQRSTARSTRDTNTDSQTRQATRVEAASIGERNVWTDGQHFFDSSNQGSYLDSANRRAEVATQNGAATSQRRPQFRTEQQTSNRSPQSASSRLRRSSPRRTSMSLMQVLETLLSPSDHETDSEDEQAEYVGMGGAEGGSNSVPGDFRSSSRVSTGYTPTRRALINGLGPIRNAPERVATYSRIRQLPPTEPPAAKKPNLGCSKGDIGGTNIASVVCAICLDSLQEALFVGKNLSATSCGHMFCHDCIFNAVLANNECPLCRAKLLPSQIIKLHLG